mmetsp:Transcript_12014/g.39547  ORF Transcript_12014/g.39547 Transcript_12014/m.39547 type:complete len:93 (-) Transcript_12014:150-428(-)
MAQVVAAARREALEEGRRQGTAATIAAPAQLLLRLLLPASSAAAAVVVGRGFHLTGFFCRFLFILEVAAAPAKAGGADAPARHVREPGDAEP